MMLTCKLVAHNVKSDVCFPLAAFVMPHLQMGTLSAVAICSDMRSSCNLVWSKTHQIVANSFGVTATGLCISRWISFC